jgi:hypothetical protein
MNCRNFRLMLADTDDGELASIHAFQSAAGGSLQPPGGRMRRAWADQARLRRR